MLRAASSFLGNRSQAAGASLASYIFNGTNERLEAAQSLNAADRTRWTGSFWTKQSTFGASVAAAYLASFHDSNSETAWAYVDPGFEDITVECLNSTSTEIGYEFTDPGAVSAGNIWEHFVVRWDSNQGTSDNRIRIYRNGSLLTDDADTTPGASAIFHFFSATHTIYIGNVPFSPTAKRMAFIDVLDGISAAPTDFAFDNGGTWTRKPYTGGYGTYGFRLDGSNGFNDASGNGRSFSGVNMDASNLDAADLPPYTT